MLNNISKTIIVDIIMYKTHKQNFDIYCQRNNYKITTQSNQINTGSQKDPIRGKD